MAALILEVSPKSAESVRTEVLPRALNLSTSPLLQGLALSSLLRLFQVSRGGVIVKSANS